VALPPGDPFVVDGNPKLLGHGFDVFDVEVDKRVGPRVTLVLREVQPDMPASDGEEPPVSSQASP
jgi:hypothetical protein